MRGAGVWAARALPANAQAAINPQIRILSHPENPSFVIIVILRIEEFAINQGLRSREINVRADRIEKTHGNAFLRVKQSGASS